MSIGHEPIKKYLQDLMTAGSGPWVFCAVGPDAVGKRMVVNEIAAKLLKITAEKVSAHPDYYFVERLTDEKTGRTKRDLTVEQARELRLRLRSRAMLGAHQVAVVDDVERLNAEAGNALLKLLEEPPAGSYIFLLTSDAGRILPTIRSRAAFLYFSSVPEAQLRQWLADAGETGERLENLLAWSAGRPGVAQMLRQSEEKYAQHLAAMQWWRSAAARPVFERFKQIEQQVGAAGETTDREKIAELLDMGLVVGRELLHKKPTQRVGAHIVATIMAGRELLLAGVKDRLVLEKIMLSF